MDKFASASQGFCCVRVSTRAQIKTVFKLLGGNLIVNGALYMTQKFIMGSEVCHTLIFVCQISAILWCKCVVLLQLKGFCCVRMNA